MGTRMQQRRGTAFEWDRDNPILADGEIGLVRDTKRIKIGDGLSTWSQLPSFIVDLAIDSENLGGQPPSAYLLATGKAADSNLLDGLDSTAFLRTTGKAADSNLLDGLDSAHFASVASLTSKLNVTGGTLAAYRETRVVNAAATGTVTLDLAVANVFELTPTGNITLAFANVPSNVHTPFSIRFANSTYAITWPAGCRFAGGIPPVLTDTTWITGIALAPGSYDVTLAMSGVS